MPGNLQRGGRRRVRCRRWHRPIARYSDAAPKAERRNRTKWIRGVTWPAAALPSTNWRRVARKLTSRRCPTRPTGCRCCRIEYHWGGAHTARASGCCFRNGNTLLWAYSFHCHPQIRTSRNLQTNRKIHHFSSVSRTILQYFYFFYLLLLLIFFFKARISLCLDHISLFLER